MSKEALSVEDTLKLALEALGNNRQTHHYCEDTWYSCPKHEDGCANESEGDECNCGADKANAEIDCAITAIKEALSSPNGEAQPAVALEQEPVATLDDLEQEIYENTRQFVSRDVMEWMLKRYYTTPPQPKEPEQGPVAWWIPKAEQFCLPSSDGTRPFAKAWEPLYTTPPQRTCENCGEFGTCCLKTLAHDAQNKENT